ncbi:NAD-dependent epimerase/dehydratase family protein [Candidatus Uhrbacteria bacterium]|nr:NAD-dependent epimerase/dehydratase family protein [Candidatus Uhrbacteria bacterium]
MLQPKGAGRPNVLVIGGAGFVGSNLCEFLLERYNVICVDNFFSGKEQNIDTLLSQPHFEFIRHDITEKLDFKNSSSLERFNVAFTGIQYVYYCASPSNPTFFLKAPLELLMANSVGVKNALDIALSYRARFILVSDALVYGSLVHQKPSEDMAGVVEHSDPLRISIQGKLFAESLAESYQKLYDLEVFIVRLGTSYGPRMHLDDSRFVPFLATRCLQNESYTISDEIRVGSYLYISDVVDALEKIALAENSFCVYNLGHGSGYSVQEVVQSLATLTGTHAQFSLGKPEASDATLQYAWQAQTAEMNIEKIKTELGWFPVVLLDDGLEKTIDYMKSLRNVRVH